MKRNTLTSTALSIALGVVASATPAISSAQTGTEFAINKDRPRLVVLLHGVTPKVSEEPDLFISKSGHARYYWGYEFIKGLQGRTDETSMQVITPRAGGWLRGRNTAQSDWKPSTFDTTPTDGAPICFPVSGWGKIPAAQENNQEFLKDYIRLMTKAKGAQNTMVMINTRDGSKHLMPQVGETIDEIYDSYVAAFDHLPINQQPQIYFVGHSFGGVIARAICTNPTEGDLWGNKLNANLRKKADYLRQRVVLIQTLAAPHDGTRIGDPAGDVSDYVRDYTWGVLRGIVAAINFVDFTSPFMSDEEANQYTTDAIMGALDAISGKRDCLQDLRRMLEYNNGILKPDLARRHENGSLIPIFTAAGRNPGGHYFEQSKAAFITGGWAMNPVTTIDLMTGTRASKEASALNLINAFMHLEGYGRQGKRPWGLATMPEGDRMATPFAGIGPANARSWNQPWFPSFGTFWDLGWLFLEGKPYQWDVRDADWDSDGFLSWDSAQAISMNHKSFYRIYDTSLYGNQLPWDNDNHGSIMFNPAVGAWIHNEILRDAGPIVKSDSRRSVWDMFDKPVTPSNNLKVEVLQVKDESKTLDYGSGADFRLTVEIDGTPTSVNLPQGDNITKGIPEFTKMNIPSTVIPIKVSIIERDNPPIDPDDICVVSPIPGKTSLYLFFDTRTKRIMGDVNGVAGDTITIRPSWWGVKNRVTTQIRITENLPV